MARRHAYSSAEQAISSRLVRFFETLPKGKQPGAVRRLVEKMDDSALEQLTAKARLSILRCMWAVEGGWLTKPRVEVTKRLLATQSKLDPALATLEQQGWTRFNRWLAVESDLADKARDWPKMAEDDRAALLRDVCKAHASAFGTEGASLRSTTFLKDKNGFVKLADYQNGAIRINLKDGPAAQSLETAVGLVTHELTHHWQFQIARKEPDMPEGSGMRAQARLFWMNFQPCYYVTGGEDVARYRHQLIESHAYQRQNDVMTAMRRRKQAKLMPPVMAMEMPAPAQEQTPSGQSR